MYKLHQQRMPHISARPCLVPPIEGIVHAENAPGSYTPLPHFESMYSFMVALMVFGVLSLVVHGGECVEARSTHHSVHTRSHGYLHSIIPIKQEWSLVPRLLSDSSMWPYQPQHVELIEV